MFQTVLDEVKSAELSKQSSHKVRNSVRPYQMEIEAEKLLSSYIDEFVCATLELSCLLAKHRNSTTVEIQDINTVLGKILTLSDFFIEVSNFCDFTKSEKVLR